MGGSGIVISMSNNKEKLINKKSFPTESKLIIMYERVVFLAREMAQWANCLLYKHEDLCLDLQQPYREKTSMAICPSNSRSEK